MPNHRKVKSVYIQIFLGGNGERRGVLTFFFCLCYVIQFPKVYLDSYTICVRCSLLLPLQPSPPYILLLQSVKKDLGLVPKLTHKAYFF